MNCLKILCSIKPIRTLIYKRLAPDSYRDHDSRLTTHLFNLQFPNRIGLGAGFDKNAKYLRELEALGFGFVEIGTVTSLPQKGNPKPRLFRLQKDKALINRMGFNNDGVKVIAKRLKDWRESQKSKVKSQKPGVRSQKSVTITHDSRLSTHGSRLIIGGNIGKNKTTPNEDAWKDYDICFKELHPYVDYFVVNVSSPNTPGLRELQEKESLRKILTHLQSENSKLKSQKPILLKIAPDLSPEQLDDVINLAMEIKLDGIVATNTTIQRSGLTTHDSQLTKIGAGGLSGLPLKHRSTEVIKYIFEKTKARPDDPVGRGQIPIIASGGIFTAEDAKEKLDAGASLVQVWTGFIYEGPAIVKKICKLIDK